MMSSGLKAHKCCSIQMPARLSSTFRIVGCLGALHLFEHDSPLVNLPVHRTSMFPSDVGGWHRQDAMHLQVGHWSGNGDPLGRIVL